MQPTRVTDHGARAAPHGVRATRWLILPLAALMLWVGWKRLSGLSPPALVQDDLWVALIVKYGSPGDLLSFVAPVPMGYVAALMLAVALVPQTTLALQLVAFVCGLALIPLTAWLTQRLTRRWELALLAAVFVAFHPFGGDYAVRVKQFTWDAAILVALVGFGLPHLDPGARARPWRLASGAATALLLSFTTVFAGAVLCHLVALRSILRRDERAAGEARAAIVAALAWDVFAVLLYALRLRHQSPDWVVEYWTALRSFPAHAPSLAQGIDLWWLAGATQRAYDSWLGAGSWWLVALSGLGVVTLLLAPRRRWQGLFFALFFLCPPLAGLLLLFPFGGGRTDFSYQPMLAALGAVGVGALAQLLAAPLARFGRIGALAPRLRTAAPVVLAVLCLLLLRYPDTRYGSRLQAVTGEHRDLVATLDAIVRPDDLVLLTPFSVWNVAYYTTLPMEIDFSQADAKLFRVDLLRPRSRHVRRPKSALGGPDKPDRVVLVALFAGPAAIAMYERDLEQASYERTFEKIVTLRGLKANVVQVWTRRPAANRAGAGGPGAP